MPHRVAVVGLGKIGLPLATQFAIGGCDVIGCDVQPDVVDAVNRGCSHVREEPGLQEAVSRSVASGRLKATTDTRAAVADSDVVIVIVPLMLGADHEVDFTHLDAATRDVAAGLTRGTLVVYETTVPVGTTRHRLSSALQAGSGLVAGIDFYLAFSPERLYAGRIFEDLRRYPKIVGGIDAESTRRAVTFYREVLEAEIWAVENAETAEFAKLAETTYRDVNIALANELAQYAAKRNVNVGEAFRAANSQPFSHVHSPSIGVGGHCIPVYPYFLLEGAEAGELRLVRDGRWTNDAMAQAAIDQLDQVLGGLAGRDVLVLGASYRENVKELAFSTAWAVIKILSEAGAHVMIHDPLFTVIELQKLNAEVVDLESPRARSADAIVVQAWHDQLRKLDWGCFPQLRAVLDGRGSLDPDSVRSSGATYIATGVSTVPSDTPK